MAISADWIAQNTATTGTGTITLGTALTGFIRLQDDSRITDGALVNYTIEDGNDREMGIGTYASAGGTLARTVVQRTLVSGTYDDSSPTAISLSGSAVVRCSAVADDRNFRGALVYHSSTQSIPSASATVLSFDSENYDTNDFHDTVTNNSRMTIPEGISYVQLNSAVQFEANSTGTRGIYLYKNGTLIGSTFALAVDTTSRLLYVSPIISVVSGDYLEIGAYQNSGVALNVNAFLNSGYHYFNLQVIS